ncbi:putative sirtuin family. Class I subfamily protein [Lyophyllum shimeji]|uniref:Sirtuin family. Class I subfamily protein n=1 Tax=Lyophyllum shimeji TaxID=47721 RepID=A0A9P3PNG3_LYOSH|nr:putative sirtuin family. Class I subfamily protein [Lyophyllum shimeji]
MGNRVRPPSPTTEEKPKVEEGKPKLEEKVFGMSKREKDIRELADFMKSDKCRRVVLMLGAGVSTSAGIPDFRSPKTGLYSNLARLNLPHPEAVFEISFFRWNPVPFYTLAAELYPGNFRPTPTHTFVKLLHQHNLLHMCFTQNIDTLERQAGVPAHKIIEAHGSFATQRCIQCKSPFPDDEMREIVLSDRPEGEEVRIPRCKRRECGGLVKPDIVFFGESLPANFIRNIPIIGEADLVIIIGTSLTVQPFASLAGMPDERRCRRALINMERVYDLGRRPGDAVLLGECDAIVRELCEALGWGEELEREWAATALEGKKEEAKEILKEVVEDEDKEKREREDELEHEVDKITESIEKRLEIQENVPETKTEPTEGVPYAVSTIGKAETAMGKPGEGEPEKGGYTCTIELESTSLLTMRLILISCERHWQG